ncbi:hypothetical protein ACFSQ0_08825 [Mesonia sediminis]|uniref:Bacterial Pleckstrin homology domain-containing protein n=1 Tax=Mesonia sediminis TaxID=1703946 RepID=A0ABW5SHA4_9FLAO
MKKSIFKFIAMQALIGAVIYFIIHYFIFNKQEDLSGSLLTTVFFVIFIAVITPLIFALIRKIRKVKPYNLAADEQVLHETTAFIPAYMSVQKTNIRLTDRNFIYWQGNQELAIPYQQISLLELQTPFGDSAYNIHLKLNRRKAQLFFTEDKEAILKILKNKL